MADNPGVSLADELLAAKAERAVAVAVWEDAATAEREAREAYHRADARLGDVERRMAAGKSPETEGIYERARRLRGEAADHA